MRSGMRQLQPRVAATSQFREFAIGRTLKLHTAGLQNSSRRIVVAKMHVILDSAHGCLCWLTLESGAIGCSKDCKQGHPNYCSKRHCLHACFRNYAIRCVHVK